MLTIVLFDRQELDARLQVILQIKTRIGFHDCLRPLGRKELVAYLSHRMTRAGCSLASPPFSPRAIGLLKSVRAAAAIRGYAKIAEQGRKPRARRPDMW